MKQFYIESGIKVCEWEKFEELLLDQQREFHFTPEQWKNRKGGRTKTQPSERLAMMAIVEEIRKRPKYQTPIVTTKFTK